MAKKRLEFEEESGGAPQWMVTFSDCMTLLLTFFVLLLSFSSFASEDVEELSELFGMGIQKDRAQTGEKNRSIAKNKDIKAKEEVIKGSRTKTFSDKSLGALSKQRRLTDFRQQKVFMIPSEKIFIGNGTAMYPNGRDILYKMSVFLKVMPSRVVISEYDPKNEHNAEKKGISRAWAVMNYFVEQNLDPASFSITGSSMLKRNEKTNKRLIVITLLEKDVYE